MCFCYLQAAANMAANQELAQHGMTCNGKTSLPAKTLHGDNTMEAGKDLSASHEADKREADKAAPETEPAAPSASMPQEQAVQVHLSSHNKVCTCVNECSSCC